MIIIVLAAVSMLVLAVLGAWILGWANKAFHVEVDPRVEKINKVLPGANCGGCGVVGCNDYAESVVAGTLGPDRCTVGGESVAEQIAEILGVDLEQSWPYRPAVHCGANYDQRKGHMDYQGEKSCSAANLVNGVQGCTYGCLGFGDCVAACKFDAIHVVEGLATVDYDQCVGCGACETACPRHIISMVPFKNERMLIVACSNKDMGKDVRAVCEVGCLGCKACERASGGAIKVSDNLPTIDYDQYDPASMDAAIMAMEKCPMKRFVSIGKPSAKDLEAVKDQDVPPIVKADFKTTVDDTEWRG
jgi:RnfABCDGE-type electron transport complex B subunit